MATVVPLSPRSALTPAPQPDALEQLASMLADDMAAVNQMIIQRMESPVALIPQLAGHLIAAGGKRLRPLLTLATARLCGYHGPRASKLATSVEFIHTATLLHDDVVDASDQRRGLPSANAVFGNQASVLVGDFLLSRAFLLMVEDGSIDVLRILSQASAIISQGEVLQLTTAGDTSTSEQAYLEVVRAKTAELFAAAARIGAVVAGRPAIEEEALRTYGLNLGIAFQIIDDVLDYAADQEKLGKTVGDDFRDGKITLPVILAIHRGSEAERAFWHRTLDNNDLREGDLAHAMDLLRRHQTLNDSVERARHYGAIARDALGIFPDHPIKSVLLDIIDFTVQREF